MWTLKYQSSFAQISTVATLTGAQGLRPVISDNPFVVARVGDTNTPSDPLTSYAVVGIGALTKFFRRRGGGNGERIRPGRPGAGDQRRRQGHRVLRRPDRGGGVGPGPHARARDLRACVVGSTPVILRVAGVTPGGIQSFDLTQPVGTNGKTVVFLATDANGDKGLFTAKLNIPAARLAGHQPAGARPS